MTIDFYFLFFLKGVSNSRMNIHHHTLSLLKASSILASKLNFVDGILIYLLKTI